MRCRRAARAHGRVGRPQDRGVDEGFWIDEAIAVGIARTSRARSRRCCARTGRRRSTTCCCTAGWACSGRRGRHTSAVTGLRRRGRARGMVGGGSPSGSGGLDLPVPHVLRAGDADVHARRRPLGRRYGRLRAAQPARSGGGVDAVALHAHVGRVPVRRLGDRQFSQSLGRARAGRRRGALRAVGPEPRVPGAAHGRAVVAPPVGLYCCPPTGRRVAPARRNSFWSAPRALPWRGCLAV